MSRTHTRTHTHTYTHTLHLVYIVALSWPSCPNLFKTNLHFCMNSLTPQERAKISKSVALRLKKQEKWSTGSEFFAMARLLAPCPYSTHWAGSDNREHWCSRYRGWMISISSLGSQPGLDTTSQPIITVFHLESLSFLLACISFAFEVVWRPL